MGESDTSDLIAELESSLAGETIQRGGGYMTKIEEIERQLRQLSTLLEALASELGEVLIYDPLTMQPTEQYAKLCEAEAQIYNISSVVKQNELPLDLLEQVDRDVTAKIWSFIHIFNFDRPERWDKGDDSNPYTQEYIPF